MERIQKVIFFLAEVTYDEFIWYWTVKQLNTYDNTLTTYHDKEF